MDLKENLLENGIKVVTIKKETKCASLRIGVKVGSMDEDTHEEGISHFIEHLMFQKTSNRDKEQLLKDLTLYGGYYNAYTCKDRTVYLSDTLCEDLENIIEVMSDMLMNSSIDKDDVERERHVIVSEIGIFEESFDEYGRDSALSIAFDGTPISSFEIGSRDTVLSFTREQIEKYYKTYYVPENTCISIVSSYEHGYVIDTLNKYFGTWKSSNLPRNERPSVFKLNSGEFTYDVTDAVQRNVHMLFEAKDLTEEEFLYLGLAIRRLGSGMFSLFWKRLRSEMALTYDAFSRLYRYGNTSIMECYTIVSEENVEKSIEAMKECIEDLFKPDTYKDNLLATKKEYLFDIISEEEAPDRLTTTIVENMLDNVSSYNVSKKIEIIKNAKTEDILNVAKKYMKNPCIVVSKDISK